MTRTRTGGMPLPWVLSADTLPRLRAGAGRLRERVLEHPDWTAIDIGYSLAVRRDADGCRAVVTGADRAELLAGLAALEVGDTGPNVCIGRPARQRSTVFFVPAPRASDLLGVDRLAAEVPAFAGQLRRCSDLLSGHVGWDIADLVTSGSTPRAPDALGPVGFAVQVALARTWRCYGVVPDRVVGETGSAVATEVIAGRLSAADAAALAAGSSAHPGTASRREAISDAGTVIEISPRPPSECDEREPGANAFAYALSRAYVSGASVGWPARFTGRWAMSVDLPQL
ncbi:acyltransferase domain-containing protein [Nocardia pseudobrasiliensis]|uniref:Acyl transferase family protein n=1 Tax=Nocardia pseudobrasiliensis TaxID=45979 RepID=A0A370IER0_9NOCA|nr:acyltransferase domain-containing protein [Nocardia pseudobrasiliensis]RDI69060.1 acyl transferase family protein [Nocardia pseudobrasiliensis]